MQQCPRQLADWLETLRTEGLHLSPREIKLMGMLAGLAFVISLLLVAIATALIF